MAESILYNDIKQDWKILEDKLNDLTEYDGNIKIEKIFLNEDALFIEKPSKSEYCILISMNFSIENEYNIIRFTSRMILIRELGFILYKSSYSPDNNEVTFNYKKNVNFIKNIKELIEKIGTKIRGFKTSIEMKEDALFVYTDGTLNTLYPYISSVEPPKHPKIKKIVDKMAEAYWKDYIKKDKYEMEWGIRKPLEIAKLLKCHPEVVYRILRAGSPRYKELSEELYKYLDAVPYTGPGRRGSYSRGSCGMAFRIKRENPYVSKLMRQLGVPLKIIFPGG